MKKALLSVLLISNIISARSLQIPQELIWSLRVTPSRLEEITREELKSLRKITDSKEIERLLDGYVQTYQYLVKNCDFKSAPRACNNFCSFFEMMITTLTLRKCEIEAASEQKK